MKKKGKGKKKGSAFKVTAKVQDNPDAQKAELQMKKKILEDKFIIQKTKAMESVRRLEEARTRFFEVCRLKGNENEKFEMIKNDFKHQQQLIQRNFEEKKAELNKEKEKRIGKKKDLEEKLDKMKQEHDKRMEDKDKMFKEIKTQMESLSQDFSNELTEIQKELKNQTEKVSQKWEKNPAEHIKTFEKEVEKYDITKADEPPKEEES